MTGLFGFYPAESGDRHLPKKQLTATYLERQNNPVVLYHLQNRFVLEIGLLFIVDFFRGSFTIHLQELGKVVEYFTIQHTHNNM